MAVDNTRREILFAMRGSVDTANWIADIKFNQVNCSDLGVPGAKCDFWFYGFWQDSKKAGALDAVREAKKQYPSYKIVSTGHSLGAAAAEMRKEWPQGVWLVSF